MRYTGIQPQYFPRLHYFARLLNTDVFVVRNDCQFVRQHKYPDGKNGKSYQAHTPIKHVSGPRLLPLSTKHEGYLPLFKTHISYDINWQEDHLKSIRVGYEKSPYFKIIFPQIEELLTRQYSNLAELNTNTIIWGLLNIFEKATTDPKLLNLDYLNSIVAEQKKIRIKKIMKATDTKSIKKIGGMSANEKIVSIIKEVGADEDYCGETSVAAYLDHDLLEKNGISIVVQDWKSKEYPQQHANLGFIPNLSIVDALMNLNSSEVRKLLS